MRITKYLFDAIYGMKGQRLRSNRCLSLSLFLEILLDPTHPHTRLTFEKIPINSVVLNSPFSPLSSDNPPLFVVINKSIDFLTFFRFKFMAPILNNSRGKKKEIGRNKSCKTKKKKYTLMSFSRLTITF